MIPASKSSWMIYFYPRPPRGGRQLTRLDLGKLSDISIHALREEGDPAEVAEYMRGEVFLSTPSARRATKTGLPQVLHIMISIHALREEGDSKNRDKISIFKQIVQHSARI